MTNNDFLKIRDWESEKREIQKQINEVDTKHTENYNNLINRIDVQTVVQRNTYESQKKSEKHLEKISENISSVGTRVTKLEFANETNEKEIKKMQTTLEEKSKGNTNIIVAWIGVVGVLLPSLVPVFSNLFDK
ncbi:hypothetical protein Southeast_023 [Staphylococcus phage Southeast]|jgi:CRISPR/Cas system-associated protein Cas5 (RAMP superfamily)|uniref:Uncharacterized protein n=1 Tax=Staphylococcus phage HS13 TaxID=3056403 RepID=A0AA50ACN9_9VIRU|nr:hypothetical protein [Staphylococcus epidermidis]USL87114.1 hypothetical protein Sazerac_023 [Staphylococcus phage Sazerac]WGL30802.1 hypothetical protein Southeast_023 [Staphylococcus phage Southeast]WLJ26076.1 MAG: hypothetical protein [Staphylococcus phage HS13]DAI53264.1 MAG TPA: hypothetical protein [Caudoviricetes sp.]